MTRHAKKLRSLAFSGLILSILPAQAWAVEAEEVATRMKAMFESQGAVATWSGVSGGGDSVTL